jgi:two-component system NtrC family sensor kinase
VRLVPKLTLWFMIAMAALLSVRGWQRVSHDSALFEADMQRDHQVVGRVFAASVGEVWRAEGEAKARDLVAVANSAAGRGAKFAWLRETTADRAEISGNDFATVGRGEEIQRFGPHNLVSLFPVRGPDSTVLVVSESLEDHDRYVRSNALHMFVSLAIAMLLCGVLAMVLSRWLVGKPASLLIEKAHRIARGDLSGPLVVRRRDELGDLAVEMNAMCDALALANARVTAETRASLAALEQLRHAERLSTVGKLAAGVAHELGTPLSVVSGHAEMIARGEVQGTKIVESASIIDREAKRIARIVRSLLDFARKKGPEGETSNVAEVAPRCAALFEPVADKTGVQIRLESSAAFPAIIDQDSLQQIVTNLLANAIQAMPSGGTVRMKVSGETVTFPKESAADPGDYVRLDILDNGSGIAPDVLPHIFEPFFSTKEPGEGTGLGLSVVYGIVEDHGGWIAVESELGKGTTFSVFLPKAKVSNEAPHSFGG